MPESTERDAERQAGQGDPWVRWNAAARAVGVSSETLTAWFKAGYVPLMVTPGVWFTRQSWIDAYLGAVPRPARAADVAEIGRAWFAARVPVGEVA